MTRHAVLILGVLCCLRCYADVEVDYERDVKPILRERCYACHGALKQESELRLDSVASILKGGDGGEVVVSKDPGASLIVERISATSIDERMPPEGSPLTAEQIRKIKQWIANGTQAPKDDAPEDAPTQHWAFQRPAAKIPMDHSCMNGNPIDSFLARSRKSVGLTTVGPVEKNLLLRRVFLDLIGLPPTKKQLNQFSTDQRPDALERIVDQLLASPQYGERWGRHWMDVWRYTDWYGLGAQLRYSQKHIWRWRDWIVQSLNVDKGYDRMIVEMLAGDEVAPTDEDVVRATGFLARNYYLFNRTTWLDSTIEHTGKAFLGLTINCAKCHDHKYDPLSHHDYYALRAIFEPHQVRLDPIAGEADLDRDGLPRAFDAHLDVATYLHVRGDPKNPEKTKPIEPGVPSFFHFATFRPTSIGLPLEAFWPTAKPFVLADQLSSANREVEKSRKKFDDAIRKLAAEKPVSDAEREMRLMPAKKEVAAASLHVHALLAAYDADRAKRMGTSDTELLVTAAAKAARQEELLRAELALAQIQLEAATGKNSKEREKNLNQATKKVAAARQAVESPGTKYQSIHASRKALEGPAETDDSRHQPYPTKSTGRRLAFAQWIIHAENPLAARVAVNHIWLRHFGQPLVESVDDFGRRAKRPVQQELLDWLSVEFMKNGWQMKPLHRLIVTSDAYRLSSETSQSIQSRDPDNQYYSRRQPIRMESQIIRDSILRLADVLDYRLHGPSIDPNSQQELHRRSLYFTHSRDHQQKLLKMFDDADIFRCYRRSESVVPQQALALANSRFSLEMAERISEFIQRRAEAGDDHGPFVRSAFECVLCRKPSDRELSACLSAMQRWNSFTDQDPSSKKESHAHRNLIHALLNHNDFITIR